MARTFTTRPPEIDGEARALLRSLAEAADEGGRRWVMARDRGKYPQVISRMGDAVLVAQCYTSPDHPPEFAQFIAAVSPPVVLALLDEIRRLQASLDSPPQPLADREEP